MVVCTWHVVRLEGTSSCIQEAMGTEDPRRKYKYLGEPTTIKPTIISIAIAFATLASNKLHSVKRETFTRERQFSGFRSCAPLPLHTFPTLRRYNLQGIINLELRQRRGITCSLLDSNFFLFFKYR